MLRCFSTLGCPERSLDGALALAAQHQLDAIELRALGGTVELPRYFAERFGTPAALAAHVRRQAVRVVAFGTSLHLGDDAPSARAAFLDFVDWAEAAGVRWLRVFDGRAGTDEPTAIARAAKTVRWWRGIRRARALHVDLMVETHDVLFTAAALGRFLAAAPDTAILWDTHHTWRKGGEDPVDTWRAVRASIVQHHVKDSIGVPSARHPYTYVLPGDGEFPMARLLAAVRADNFDGPVSLEWERMWHSYLPPLEVALATAAARRWW